MNDFKTVEGSSRIREIDPLYMKQKEDVSRMRTSLLACNGNPELAQTAMKSIAVLRVYHQLTRIIRYTELMDKLEAKLYESLDFQIDHMGTDSASTWITLLNIQERLQKNMIESAKLLQPYMDIAEFTAIDVSQDEPTHTISLDEKSRERLRDSARQVLKELNAG